MRTGEYARGKTNAATSVYHILQPASGFAPICLRIFFRTSAIDRTPEPTTAILSNQLELEPPRELERDREPPAMSISEPELKLKLELGLWSAQCWRLTLTLML
jgi:hypothetical protein